MKILPAKLSLVAASVVGIVALASAPAAALSPADASGAAGAGQTSIPLCTGTKANFKCDPAAGKVPLGMITNYLHGNGSTLDQAALEQQIETFAQTLNQGNGAPGSSGWQGFTGSLPGGNGAGGNSGSLPGGSGGAQAPPDLGQLQSMANQFLNGLGAGNAGSGTPGGGIGQGGQGNGGAGTPGGGNGGQGNSGNPSGNGNAGGSAQGVAERCQQIQDMLNTRIANLNKQAQGSLASLDETMKKLQAYQSGVDTSQLPANYQQLVQQALQAQSNGTTAVATLALLNIKIDCSQANPAQGISIIKSATDAARSQLQDFAKSLQAMATDLAGKAKP